MTEQRKPQDFQLIKQLVDGWSDKKQQKYYYIGELLPSLLKNPYSGTKKEGDIIAQLKNMMSDKHINEAVAAYLDICIKTDEEEVFKFKTIDSIISMLPKPIEDIFKTLLSP